MFDLTLWKRKRQHNEDHHSYHNKRRENDNKRCDICDKDISSFAMLSQENKIRLAQLLSIEFWNGPDSPVFRRR